MAKVTLPPQFLSIRGRFGDVVFKKVNGRTIVAKLPRKSRRRPTQAQTAVRERFRAASSYATHVLKDPDQRLIYEIAARDKHPGPYAAAMADFFRPPEVRAIELHGYQGRSGDTIIVHATDDTGVASLYITLRLRDGKVLEQGFATRTEGWWIYRAKADALGISPLTIEATAADLPGNRTTATAQW